MKSDLDALMAKRGLDAIIVTGDEHANPPRHYLTNGAMVTGGYVLKKRGSDPVMVVNPMEIEEAAKSGLQVYSYNDFDWGALYKQMDGDMHEGDRRLLEAHACSASASRAAKSASTARARSTTTSN